MKKLVGIIGCAALLAFASAQAAEHGAGKEKSRTCAACHGVDGNSAAPDFPRLAGQNADYLVKAMKDYKSGLRKNPIMAPMAAPLTARDMAELAEYYAAQPGLTLKY
jgi:cytochrome c553